jgi:hypothetical protein
MHSYRKTFLIQGQYLFLINIIRVVADMQNEKIDMQLKQN